MPLRDLLVAGILASTVPFVFRYAFIGVLLWTWVGMMNPHRLGWGFMYNAPIALLIAAITIFALFTTRDRVKLPKNPSLVILGLFIFWTCITTAFAFYFSESLVQLEKVIKIQLFIFVTAAVLYKYEHIRLFIWVNALSIAYFGAKGGLYTIRTAGGGMVLGPPGSFISGNTEIGLATVMAIPLLYFLRLTTPHRLVRHGLLLIMGLCALAALGTQSRGAFLAVAAMGALLWWRAPHKLINLLIVIFLAVNMWTFMPESWHEKMGTIQAYEEDASAMGRIYAWETAVNIANDRIVGGGFQMYKPDIFAVYAPDAGDRRFDSTIARAAHSIYFQVLGEHGYIGLILFLGFFYFGWRTASRLRRNTKGDSELEWIYHFAGMAQVSLVGYFVGGAFLSLAYWDMPYNIVIALVVAERWRKERTSMPEVQPPVPPDDVNKKGAFQRIFWWARQA